MSILTKHKRESPYILLVTDAWQPQRDNKCMISERNILFWGGGGERGTENQLFIPLHLVFLRNHLTY